MNNECIPLKSAAYTRVITVHCTAGVTGKKFVATISGRQSVYIPDFLVMFRDKTGKTRTEMIEIKPAKEVPGATSPSGRITKRTQLTQAINAAKWQAAMRFCAKRGIFFRIMTEKEMFAYNKKKK